MDGAAPQRLGPVASIGRIAAMGPGLLVMLADTDAGNVVTSAEAGATWGYRLLPLLLALIPVLYMVQELTVRLGLSTGRGYGELVRDRFGRLGAWLALLVLAAAVIGSLITEFTGVAGIGELYGLGRGVTLPIAAGALIAVVATGSYRRVERIATLIGLFEVAFFVVAWQAHPRLAAVAHDVTDLPFGDAKFIYLQAAIIGAVFNPWMIFYQQSAIAEKRLGLGHLRAARLDTAFGAVLTQCLTAAVLVAVAATSHRSGAPTGLGSVGEISGALTTFMGERVGRAIFSTGVMGASLVAAIVSSLALAWGFGEITGSRHALEYRPHQARWFHGLYGVCVVGSAALVGLAPDLVWLNLAAQALNALLLPLVLLFLVLLSVQVLAEPVRPRGAYLWLVVGASTVIAVVGVVGCIAGLMT